MPRDDFEPIQKVSAKQPDRTADLEAKLTAALETIASMQKELAEVKARPQQLTVQQPQQGETYRQMFEQSVKIIEEQRAYRNHGEHVYRITVKKFAKPIIMHCDAPDPVSAIGVFQARFGTTFDGRKMTITKIEDHSNKVVA